MKFNENVVKSATIGGLKLLLGRLIGFFCDSWSIKSGAKDAGDGTSWWLSKLLALLQSIIGNRNRRTRRTKKKKWKEEKEENVYWPTLVLNVWIWRQFCANQIAPFIDSHFPPFLFHFNRILIRILIQLS